MAQRGPEARPRSHVARMYSRRFVRRTHGQSNAHDRTRAGRLLAVLAVTSLTREQAANSPVFRRRTRDRTGVHLAWLAGKYGLAPSRPRDLADRAIARHEPALLAVLLGEPFATRFGYAMLQLAYPQHCPRNTLLISAFVCELTRSP